MRDDLHAVDFRGKPSIRMRDVPLRVRIVDGSKLVIEIGLNTLACVFENGPCSHDFRLLDVDTLAKEVVVILENDEDEIGLTPIMHAIDNAIEQVVSDGSTAVEEKTEEEKER